MALNLSEKEKLENQQFLEDKFHILQSIYKMFSSVNKEQHGFTSSLEIYSDKSIISVYRRQIDKGIKKANYLNQRLSVDSGGRSRGGGPHKTWMLERMKKSRKNHTQEDIIKSTKYLLFIANDLKNQSEKEIKLLENDGNYKNVNLERYDLQKISVYRFKKDKDGLLSLFQKVKNETEKECDIIYNQLDELKYREKLRPGNTGKTYTINQANNFLMFGYPKFTQPEQNPNNDVISKINEFTSNLSL